MGLRTVVMQVANNSCCAGSLDPNQPFVTVSPQSVLVNEEAQFTLFGTPLGGSKAAFVSGTNCGGTKLYVVTSIFRNVPYRL